MGTIDTTSDAEQLRLRNKELRILNKIAGALNKEVDLSRALQTTLALVAELLGLDTGWVWLRREESGNFYLAAAQNLPPALSHHPKRMEGSCYCLDSYREGGLSRAENISVITCSRLEHLDDETEGLRYHASIPLDAHDKELGVLNVASADWRELSKSKLRLLHTIGDLLSIAIERARLFEASTQLGAVEERNRLAREIHDTLAQGLTGIALRLESADALLEVGEGERAREAVRQALDLTRHNIDDARRSVLDLRAAPLEGRSLAEAIAAMLAEIEERHEIETHIKLVGANQPLPVRLESGLYRIAQEACSNVIRHAHANKLVVHLVISPSWLKLAVQDDGSGFSLEEIPEGRYGLVGLSERARLLGGELAVCSGPDEGTQILVKIPLDEEDEG